MISLRSARSRAIAAGVLGLLLLAGVATTAAADRAADTTLWLLIGLGAAAFVTVVGVVAGVIVSTTRPLAALRASARAITAGDPQARARVSGPEEVASLARDFNAMTDALAARAEEYIATTNLTGDIIVKADRDGRWTFLNDAACQFYGGTREELLGARFPDCVHPEDVASTAQTIRDAIASKELVRGFVNRQLTPAGTRVVEWNGYPLFDDEGRYAGLQATGRDITERKRAEEALRESERRFSTLVGSTFEGLVIHDRGKILDANPAFARMFGYGLSEVIGMHALDFTAPESRDLLWQSILSRRVQPFEALGLKKDGSILVCELLGRDIQHQERTATVTAVRDITERKRAEEALQKVREEIESRVERRMQQVNGYRLTFRELAVLHLVAAGESDKEIATVLGISPLTAHKHLANILEKMGAASRTEAGVRALREGLLD